MFGCTISAAAVEAPDSSDETVITLREDKRDDEKPRQRMPAYLPVYCQVGADHVIFFCRHEAVGEISVTDADGAVIATAVAELSAGLTVMLPGGVTPGMTLRATIGDVTYSATI
ncbi:MAG: hypothetical protein K2K40_08295 [Paramuribaculum sp.]|nr:hypothetical protein [Paramuribaculum sp.]